MCFDMGLLNLPRMEATVPAKDTIGLAERLLCKEIYSRSLSLNKALGAQNCIAAEIDEHQAALDQLRAALKLINPNAED